MSEMYYQLAPELKYFAEYSTACGKLQVDMDI